MNSKWLSEISSVSTANKKKSRLNEKEVEKANDKHKIFLMNTISQSEMRGKIIRQRAKQLVLTEEDPCLGEIIKLSTVVVL